MTEGLGKTSERTALARARNGLDRYVGEARRTSHEIAGQVELFARRLAELRSLAQPDAEHASAGSELLLRRVHLQDQELTLALEELRAQNAALVESVSVLEQERARYVDLFDHAPDAYVTTNLRGVIREANAAAAALLGLEQRAMPGKLLIAFVARRDTRAFRRILVELEQPGTSTFSLHLRARGGAPFPASLSLRRIRLSVKDASDLRWTIRPSTVSPSEA